MRDQDTQQTPMLQQTRLLQETVRYVYEHSGFYKTQFLKAGITPQDVTSFQDLVKIPFTTKDDFSQQTSTFLCVDSDEIIDIATTSGTSGSPMMIPLTAQDLTRLAQNEALAFKQLGLNQQDTVALAVTMDRCFMAGLAYFQGLQKMGATAIRVGSGSPAMLLKMIERAKVTTIITVPSFLKRITIFAQSQQIELRKNSVRKIICIGEPIRKADLTLNAFCAKLENEWQAKMFSTYGSTEIEGSFCECEYGCGGHIQPEHMFAEIITPQGHRAAIGEVGELCVTTFGIRAMPVLRYRTGDYTFMMDEPCPCGRTTPRIGPILGRRDQMLKIKGTTIFPGVIHDIVQQCSDVSAHVLIVEKDEPLSDKLTLLVDVEEPTRLIEIGEAIQGEIKVTPEIRFTPARDIQALQTAGDYRKRRMLIDKRQG